MSESTAAVVADLIPKNEWRRVKASHLFPSDSSLEWFIRTHRDRLISEGAYIPRGGRSPSLCTPRMDTLVPEILAE